ncbi:MAG: hypothetical protein WDM88_01980, partial [Galbitalea sp.]
MSWAAVTELKNARSSICVAYVAHSLDNRVLLVRPRIPCAAKRARNVAAAQAFMAETGRPTFAVGERGRSERFWKRNPSWHPSTLLPTSAACSSYPEPVPGGAACGPKSVKRRA